MDKNSFAADFLKTILYIRELFIKLYEFFQFLKIKIFFRFTNTEFIQFLSRYFFNIKGTTVLKI